MLALRIAFRYLKAKKSHTAVNVITWIAVVGVAVASMAMVIVLSVYNGFTNLALSQLSNLDPDIAIVPRIGSLITGADSIQRVIEPMPDIASISPTVTGHALLVDGETRLPVSFKGVPDGYHSASDIENIIIAGQYACATSDGIPAAQLSVGVANAVQSYPSAETMMQIYVPRRKGRINPANPMAAFRVADIAFSGVFSANNTELDQDLVIIPLSTARNLLDLDDQASAIEIRLLPEASSERVITQLRDKLGDKFLILDRLQQRPDSFRMISVEKWVTFMMLACILVIALFNVVATLSLLALEKRDNMTTLRALGAKPSLIRRIFISEGFLVTIIGGAVGIAVGLLLSLAQQYLHVIRLNADAAHLTVSYYPVSVQPLDLLVVAAVITLLALLTASLSRLLVREPRPLNKNRP